MTQAWKNTGSEEPTSSTGGADRFADHTAGIYTAVTHYYAATDPSSGASWGADELGIIWIDSTNEIDAAGDDLGPVVKRWVMATDAPTYGWRTLGARSYVALEPNVVALDLSNQSTTGFADLDLNAETSSLAISALVQVQCEDSGTTSASVFASLRKNGTTTDANVRKVYPQVTDIPVTCMFLVELDASQVCEYAINASGASAMDLRIDVLGYYERA